MHRALLFDRVIEVDTAAQVVRVRPQRFAALVVALLLVATPLALLAVVQTEPYELTTNGVLFVGGCLVIATLIAGAAFSPANRRFELDLAHNIARFGSVFDLTSAKEIPIGNVSFRYELRKRRTSLRPAMNGEAWFSVAGSTPVRLLSLANGYQSLAEMFVVCLSAALSGDGDRALPVLASAVDEAGRQSVKSLVAMGVFAIVGPLILYWFYLR